MKKYLSLLVFVSSLSSFCSTLDREEKELEYLKDKAFIPENYTKIEKAQLDSIIDDREVAIEDIETRYFKNTKYTKNNPIRRESKKPQKIDGSIPQSIFR